MTSGSRKDIFWKTKERHTIYVSRIFGNENRVQDGGVEYPLHFCYT